MGWIPNSISGIDDLSDVDTSTASPATGDLLEWDGSNWVPVDEGLTTKGDLLTHDGTDYKRLAVGTNGQVLEADSSESLGVKWAAAGGGGFTFSGCSLHRNGTAQSITGGAGEVAILWTTEDYDTDSYHSTVSNTSRVTAPSADKYLVTGILGFADLDNQDLVARIRKNGSTEIARVIRQMGSLTYLVRSFSYVVDLGSSDYIEITVQQVGGSGGFTVDGDRVDTCIQVTKLG